MGLIGHLSIMQQLSNALIWFIFKPDAMAFTILKEAPLMIITIHLAVASLFT
jgi:hypothetical protein